MLATSIISVSYAMFWSMERRGEGNDYPFLLFRCLKKLSKGKGNKYPFSLFGFKMEGEGIKRYHLNWQLYTLIVFNLLDKDSLYLEISSFIHFMVKILFHKSNDI